MLEIRVKRDVLAKYNLHAGDVNQVIAAALGGESVGTMIEGNRRFDIVVRLAEADREKLETIRALPVRVGESGLLPLGDVADIQRVKTVSPILRDSGQRRAALMVNLQGRDVESWVREADAKVREQFNYRKATPLSLAVSLRIFVKQRRDLRSSCPQRSHSFSF